MTLSVGIRGSSRRSIGGPNHQRKVLTAFNPVIALSYLWTTQTEPSAQYGNTRTKRPSRHLRVTTHFQGGEELLACSKEALVMSWTTRRLHKYLYGMRSKITIDYKPLKHIFSFSNAIQCLQLRDRAQERKIDSARRLSSTAFFSPSPPEASVPSASPLPAIAKPSSYLRFIYWLFNNLRVFRPLVTPQSRPILNRRVPSIRTHPRIPLSGLNSDKKTSRFKDFIVRGGTAVAD